MIKFNRRTLSFFAFGLLAFSALLCLQLFALTPTHAQTVWHIGDKVGLQKGALIHQGSAFEYPINACVPENDWLVLVIAGPRYAEGYVWYGVDRKALDQLPTSGTGWIAPDAPVLAACPTVTPTPTGGGETMPPIISNVKPRQDGLGDVIVSATITDDTQVAFAQLITPSTAVAMVKGSGSRYYGKIGPFRSGTTVQYQISAVDIYGNVATYPSSGWATVKIFMTSQLGHLPWTTSVGEPVSLPLGNFVTQHTDLMVTGPGLPFAFARTYNTQAPTDGPQPFGIGWTYSYNFRLDDLSDPFFTGVIVTYPDGHTAIFSAQGAGYVASPGDADVLTRTGSGFTLLTPDRLQYQFDSQGQLLRVVDRNNNTITLAYNGSTLAKIVDTVGRIYTFTADGSGHITSLTDPIGRKVTYSYGSSGTLSSVLLPGNRTLTYGYDPSNRMITITDPNSHTFVTNTYDDRDRVTEQKDAAGAILQLQYSGDDSQVVSTDAEGHPTTYTFNTDFLLVKETDALNYSQQYQYDPNFNRTLVVDRRGNPTHYGYDHWNNVINITDALNNQTIYQYMNGRDLVFFQDATGAQIRATYDGNGNRTSVTTVLGTVRYHYNSRGQVIETDDARNNATFQGYDLDGNLSTITDAETHQTTLKYDQVSRLVSMTDANKHSSQFVYDDADRLIKTTDPLQKSVSMVYDGVGNLLSVLDRTGALVVFSYNANDQLSSVRDALGYTTSLAYDKTYHVRSITDRRNAVTTFDYDAVYNRIHVTDPYPAVTAYTYDANRQLMSVVDANNHTTSYQRDAVNRITQITDALNQLTTISYDGVGNITSIYDARKGTTKFTYNALRQLSSVTDALNGLTSYTYDPNGNLTQVTDALLHSTNYVFDKLNRPIQSMDALHQSQGVTYDPVGNVLKFTDKKNNTTSFTYDADDRLVQVLDAASGLTAYGLDAEGRVTSLTNPNQHTTSLTYSLRGELTQIKLPGGQTTTLSYDENGNQTSIKSAEGNTSRFGYDARNMLIQSTDPNQNPTFYQRDPVGLLSSMTDALTRITRYQYDPLNRLTAVTQDAITGQVNNPKVPDQNVQTNYTYDPLGALLSVTDARNNTWNFKVDVLGRVIQEQNPLGNTWHYSYDAVSNLTQRLDANHATSTYTYDPLNRLTGIAYSDGTHTSYTFDPNNNLVGMHDLSGQTAIGYDALDRLTSIGKTSGILSGQKMQRSYDAASNLTGVVYPDGRKVQYAYNSNEWLTSTTDPGKGVTTYGYNLDGLLTQQNNPNGTSVTRQYDPASQLLSLVNSGPDGTFAGFAYTYDAVGNRIKDVQTLLGPGVPQTLPLAPQSTPATPATPQGAPTYVPPVSQNEPSNQMVAYYMDHASNTDQAMSVQQGPAPAIAPTPTPITTSGSGRPTYQQTIMYGYDGLNRLSSAQYSNDPGNFFNYTYDLNGNVLSEKTNWNDKQPGNKPESVTRNFSYNAANELTSVDSTQFKYDGNGNRIGQNGSDGKSAYTYNIENQLVAVQNANVHRNNTVPDANLTMTYDGLGRRAQETVSDKGVAKATNSFYSDFGYDPAVISDTPGQTTNYYYDTLAQRLSMQEIQGKGAGLQYFYSPDGVGSTAALTNQSGHEVHGYQYAPFGTLRDVNGADNSSNFTDPHNAVTFDGVGWDQEMGAYNFGARLYNPSTLNWLTQDLYRGTITNPSSLNRYLFVQDNPINLADVNGLWGLPTGSIWGQNPVWLPLQSTIQNIQSAAQMMLKSIQNVFHYGISRNTQLPHTAPVNASPSPIPSMANKPAPLEGIPFNENAHAEEFNCPEFAVDYSRRTDIDLRALGIKRAEDLINNPQLRKAHKVFQLTASELTDLRQSRLRSGDFIVYKAKQDGADPFSGHVVVFKNFLDAQTIFVRGNFWCSAPGAYNSKTGECNLNINPVNSKGGEGHSLGTPTLQDLTIVGQQDECPGLTDQECKNEGVLLP